MTGLPNFFTLDQGQTCPTILLLFVVNNLKTSWRRIFLHEINVYLSSMWNLERTP